MGQDVMFSCKCGTVRGRLCDVDAKSGMALTCHCSYCRAAEVHLGQPDPAPDGVTLYQTTANIVQFETGREAVSAFRFNPKGMIRWHATCCGSPLFNTMAHPGTGFASLVVARVDTPDALGPVRTVLGKRNAAGKESYRGVMPLVLAMMIRTVRMKLSGDWRKTPFFRPDGTANGEVILLTAAQTSALPLNH